MALKDINLIINGDPRQASAGYDVQKQQYQVVLPGKDVSEKPYEVVQGSEAVYDKDGKLLRVGALGYSPEGGYYRMQWPSKQDSIYNANAAKEYAPQVFQQVKKKEEGGAAEYVPYATQGLKFREVQRPDTTANTYPIYDSNGKIINRQQGGIPSVDITNYQNPYSNYQGEGRYGVVQDSASGKYYQVPLNYNPQNITHIDDREGVVGTPAWNRAHGYTQTDKNGMKMNYSQYLQAGGTAEDQTQQIVAQVIAALKQDPEATMKKLQEMGEQGKQLFELALQADPELQEMFSQSMKCGGAVRAKVKKAKCGKKLENGDKIQKASTGCTCQLKRVGGKLIEVDSCTGLPIHKSGGVMKFQNPAQTITTGYTPALQLFGAVANTGRVSFVAPHTSTTATSASKTTQNSSDLLSQEEVADMIAQSRQGVEALNQTIARTDSNSQSSAQKSSSSVEGGKKDTTTDTHYTIGQKGTGTNAGKVWNGNAWAAQTYGQINAAKAGMANADGTGWDLAKRKEWMNSDEGKAYLASLNNGQGLGFSANNYTGTAAQNRALFGAYSGFADWKKQRTAAPQAAATTTTPNVFGNDMTNRQLLQYDPEKEGAQALSTEAAARRQKILDAERANRTALTWQGTEYNSLDDVRKAQQDLRMNGVYRQWSKAVNQGTIAHDPLTMNRFAATQQRMLNDNNFLMSLGGMDGSDKQQAREYINTYYKGAEKTRALRILDALDTTGYYPVSADDRKVTDIDWDATTFKHGGIISYKDYLNN